jgi:hypothetical protein
MMPARGLRPGRRLLTLIAVGVFVSAGVKAQSSVTLKATVSEAVSLSVLANSIDADVVSIGNTVRVTLSSTGSPVIRVPLLVRSNSGFKISAMVESTTAELAELSVVDVHATGTLVASDAITGLNVPPKPLDLSRPFLVATGPRVSLGGTLNSPNNALEIAVLIHLKPAQSRDWQLQLTFVATPGSPIP